MLSGLIWVQTVCNVYKQTTPACEEFGLHEVDTHILVKMCSSVALICCQVKTPTMLMIGLGDLRCPPKQSYELYKALRARDVPVR